MTKLPEPPTVVAMRAIPPDVRTLPAETRLWRVYVSGGDHPSAWDRMRAFGPLPDARFDHHAEPQGVQEREILYGAIGDQTVAACSAEVLREVTNTLC